MPALSETARDFRIEFGQIREFDNSPTQLTFNLENVSQITLFNSNLEKFPGERMNDGDEIVVFKNTDLEKLPKSSKGQISIKSFGAYPDSDPDQLILHYIDEENNDSSSTDDQDNSEIIPFTMSVRSPRRKRSQQPIRRR